jgi:hypothetical protein
MRSKFHEGTCRTRAGVCGISIGHFEIMAMKTSALIINEVHGHNLVPCLLVPRSPIYTVDEL